MTNLLDNLSFRDWWLLLTSVTIGVFVFQSLVFLFGLFRLPKQVQLSQGALPFVSVVIAARNEEQNIGRTLQSLSKLDYPKTHYEIIVVDGASVDRTAEIVKEHALLNPVIRLIPVDLTRPLKGKANAIDQAIDVARGEIIMMTDADCEVEPTWISTAVKHFTEPIGLVCGVTLPKGYNFFSKIQAIDWAYILGTSSALASLGVPIGGIGNNFNFRKQTYQEIGGYRNIKFSVTEDFMLFQTIARSRWKIAFPALKEMHNVTEPMPTIEELYIQKKRWTLGALDASFGQSLYATLMFMVHALTLISVFILPASVWAPMMGIKILADAIIITPVMMRFEKLKYFIAYPAFQIYFYFYVLLVPFILLFSREVVWKGITYQVSTKT
ncbi:MAG: glycosyltransferase [Chloroherpetonaceae bacterium]|nr:glycosyltransferase [Chloroherpetonaceae bacterium]